MDAQQSEKPSEELDQRALRQTYCSQSISCFKLVLLESLLDVDGVVTDPNSNIDVVAVRYDITLAKPPYKKNSYGEQSVHCKDYNKELNRSIRKNPILAYKQAGSYIEKFLSQPTSYHESKD